MHSLNYALSKPTLCLHCYSVVFLQLQKEETVLPHEWDDPTEEEREEDLREDEQCARWENETANLFVSNAMIRRPFERPRPVVLCLSRDVPESAKKSIVKRLEHDLPGLTIHIDEEDDMGLNASDLQQALSVRCGLTTTGCYFILYGVRVDTSSAYVSTWLVKQDTHACCDACSYIWSTNRFEEA